MVSKLKVLASSAASHGKLETMEREAVDIFRKAVELDEIFRLSRSDYQIFITRLSPPQAKPPDLGFDFDTRTMEIIRDFSTMSPPEKTTKVDLAISPGILKAGNTDGTNYGTESILAKLRALCNLKELLQMFAPDPNPNQEGETRNNQVMLSSPKTLQPQIETERTSSSAAIPMPTADVFKKKESPKRLQPHVKTESTFSSSAPIPNFSSSSCDPMPISDVFIKKEPAGETDDEVSMLVEPAPEKAVEQQQQDQNRGLYPRLPQFMWGGQVLSKAAGRAGVDM
ncbi:uncharacterized protein C8A04DRAFT_10101 [Dichotomopilus funicola]|uniref:Uncharacterized protein n=1 Tax=Dichotomopilus funicola TaxID=1934379 RepID=A0AAN6V7E0_9PEZI|nr:hypothetical protein C8A04DRAFT_10101 [Dichotomopilus funicola]